MPSEATEGNAPSPPKQFLATVISNVVMIPDHKVITFHCPEIAALARPGHFVNILVSDGFDPFLRKPFSVYRVDRERGEVSVLFSIVGATTRGMGRKREGDDLDLVGPLGGRIFTPDLRDGVRHVMVGGGYGVPPLVFLSQEIVASRPGSEIVFLIGARQDSLLVCTDDVTVAGYDVRIATEDGSRGVCGRVTDVLAPILADDVEGGGGKIAVYCCGPTPMMRAVADLCERHSAACQVSIEVAMPCGMGVCMACVIDTRDGRRVRSCTDGPVFQGTEVAW